MVVWGTYKTLIVLSSELFRKVLFVLHKLLRIMQWVNSLSSICSRTSSQEISYFLWSQQLPRTDSAWGGPECGHIKGQRPNLWWNGRTLPGFWWNRQNPLAPNNENIQEEELGTPQTVGNQKAATNDTFFLVAFSTPIHTHIWPRIVVVPVWDFQACPTLIVTTGHQASH